VAVAVQIDMVGAKEALRALNRIDKTARRQVTKDFAQIVSPVVNEARAKTPASPPLSGMAHGWNGRSGKPIFPWNAARTDRAIKPFVSAKKPRQFGQFVSDLATFGIKWTSADASVLEMSGRGPVPTMKGQQMVRELTARYGAPGRFIWNAYQHHANAVLANVERLIRDVMRRVEGEM